MQSSSSSCLLGLLLVAVLIAVQADGDRSYSVELNSFEPSKDFESNGKWLDWGSLRMKKVGRNQYTLAGEMDVKLNLGDEQRLAVLVYTYDSGANQKGPLVMSVNKPFCQFVSEDKDTYPFLRKVSDLPDPTECPFPKGHYTIDNYKLETTFLPDDAPKGDYMLELNLYDQEVPVASILAQITLT
ncbi:uncharacterized protein LOC115629372 [Scaptodrosophila lebanonensis]|uniref:Uncharacterized protein LOC115629372 n=1 Tax=Drosophila lebanonensis TaxID=7225 RepID=A0A6J2U1B5_DROLE|nr:uncharacterized protein LOC115629372 [Scaptodrosophila lebanonensis]